MNNINNWLIAVGIVVLLGGTAWWLYSNENPTSTNSDSKITTTENSSNNAAEPTGKLATPIGDTDWTIGPADAPVQIVEYADYQCPACKSLSPLFKSIVEQFPEQASFTYRHFPLSYHELAQESAEITEAAGAQGKFWEMQEWFFANNFTIDSAYEYAASLGLDVDRMKQEVADGLYAEKVNNDYLSGQQSGVPGTPTLFLNGELLDWEKTQDLEGTINSLLNQ